MKIKIFLTITLGVLLALSALQMFSLPPYAGDIFGAYKSGYFSEIERGFLTIRDSFLGIKMYSRPVYAWIFLKDIEGARNIKIRVYDRRGYEVPAPGEKMACENPDVPRILNAINPEMISAVKRGTYYCALPVMMEDRCRFCHRANRSPLAGVMTFERPFDAMIYYSSERTIVFGLISAVLAVALIFVLRWDPGRKIKELFDKQR